MSQGNDFANYSASTAAPATASGDVWFVAVASDDIKQMNVEQLDEAFRLGIITAQTAVWTEGMEAWAPLGEVADLGADDDDDAAPESSEYTARSEIGSGVVNASAQSASPQHHAAPQHHAHSHAAPLHQSGSFSGGPSSFAPVTASYAPSPFVQSTVPVALNVDEDMPPINVGRRFKPERWLLAAAAVVGLGVTAYNNSDLFASTPGPVASAAAAADSKPASRGYDVGGDVRAGVEKGAALPTQPASNDEPAADKPTDDAPIGASASLSAKEASPTKEAAASATDKDNLKGSFTKAFNKKPAPAKPAKATKAAKPRKTATKAPATKAKKSSAPKASSAFDPLNDSLP